MLQFFALVLAVCFGNILASISWLALGQQVAKKTKSAVKQLADKLPVDEDDSDGLS